MITRALLLSLLLAAGLPAPAPADPPAAAGSADPATGRYLVATQQIRGNVFQRSVVFLTDYGPGRAMGLIVNRPTTTPLAEVFPGLPERVGSVHVGGPVDREYMMVLIRSETRPASAEAVVDGVWLTGDEESVRAAAEGPDAPRNMRVFAGYAGWTAGQLDREIARGDWLVVDLEPDTLFDAPTASLWKKLYERHRKLIALR